MTTLPLIGGTIVGAEGGVDEGTGVTGTVGTLVGTGVDQGVVGSGVADG